MSFSPDPDKILNNDTFVTKRTKMAIKSNRAHQKQFDEKLNAKHNVWHHQVNPFYKNLFKFSRRKIVQEKYANVKATPFLQKCLFMFVAR